MKTLQKPVAIVGAGLAGLTAATYLKRHGIPIRVFEASKNLAGLCRSERDPDGFTYDFGAHFITNRLAAAVGCSATCREMPAYGESVWDYGRSYSYPLGLMRNPKFTLSAAFWKLTGLFRGQAKNAADWFRQAYGRVLADRVAIPLTEAWSGVPANELAPSIGNKFATSLPRTLMIKATGRLNGRTVAVGYSGTVPESPHVWHVYPDGGIGAVCDQLANEVQEFIQTQSPVEGILVENDQVVAVRVNREEIPCSAVVSTAPLPILAKLVQGTDCLAHLSRFRYRPMVFVNLRFSGPSSGLPNVVTWTPGQETPFFRLSDIGKGLPWLVPEGKSLITADIGCQVGDATWTASESELAERCLVGLEKMLPGISARYLGCRVMKTPIAYPVYANEYEEDRVKLQSGTGIRGLVTVGRNGEFAHILMEDVYWRTRRKMLILMEDLCN